jgi:alkanesulfonate monooxygenase SsuD/methylene tetrahydromethanopterin reductase-like flavin-dependent oxidoreductase (luciferase family)
MNRILYERYLDLLDYGYPAPDEMAGVCGGNWECWTWLAAVATTTERVELGALVTNTTFRNSELLANMAETVDSLSDYG